MFGEHIRYVSILRCKLDMHKTMHKTFVKRSGFLKCEPLFRRAAWEVIIPNLFDEGLWLKDFRLAKTTFQVLCNVVGLFCWCVP